jgi:hypothetical protein
MMNGGNNDLRGNVPFANTKVVKKWANISFDEVLIFITEKEMDYWVFNLHQNIMQFVV